jgi:hypothetical protein
MLKRLASMENGTSFPHSQSQRRRGFALAVAYAGGRQSAPSNAGEGFNLIVMQIFLLVASYLTTICLVPDVNQKSDTMERHYPYAQA